MSLAYDLNEPCPVCHKRELIALCNLDQTWSIECMSCYNVISTNLSKDEIEDTIREEPQS